MLQADRGNRLWENIDVKNQQEILIMGVALKYQVWINILNLNVYLNSSCFLKTNDIWQIEM